MWSTRNKKAKAGSLKHRQANQRVQAGTPNQTVAPNRVSLSLPLQALLVHHKVARVTRLPLSQASRCQSRAWCPQNPSQEASHQANNQVCSVQVVINLHLSQVNRHKTPLHRHNRPAPHNYPKVVAAKACILPNQVLCNKNTSSPVWWVNKAAPMRRRKKNQIKGLLVLRKAQSIS